jgi:hypothetical protein
MKNFLPVAGNRHELEDKYFELFAMPLGRL